MRLLEHKVHLFRMAALFVAGGVVFVLLRVVMVPKTFGVYGHYQAAALVANRQRVPVFAGRTACVECHTDIPEAQKGSLHAAVGCEACHGPQAAHASDPSEKNTPAKLDPMTLCLTCHLANVAKPAKFKQVDPKDHGEGASCTNCHDPHAPEKEPKKAEPKEETKAETKAETKKEEGKS